MKYSMQYKRQFEFCKKMWETSTGQKYTGSIKEKVEIEKKIELMKQLMEVA